MASAKKAGWLLARDEGSPALMDRVQTLLATVAREESAARVRAEPGAGPPHDRTAERDPRSSTATSYDGE